jgi:hypothetical protein
MQLLMMDEVREEIEVTEDQAESIRKAAEEQRAGRDRADRPNFRDMTDEEREKAMAEMRERFEKDAKEAKAKISEILLPHQMERLDQIALQMQGAMALVNDDVAKKVGLSEKDIENVKQAAEKAQQSMRDQMREIFGAGDREGMAEKVQALRKKMDDDVLAVLSDVQRESFEKMKGEKFELPQGAFGRGFGGRPGGPGGRPGGGGGRQRPQRPANQ